MLFNSYEFIFLFLPLTLLTFYVLSHFRNVEAGISSLVIASFIFYGWWNYAYLTLLLASIIVNYTLGRLLVDESKSKLKFQVLITGIIFNLGLIGYYKYSGFLVGIFSPETSADWNLQNIILPLGISFFTFQQISFLVDCYKGLGKEKNLKYYFLFVSFFPQLIAGPIVHHSEMIPQFRRLKPFGQIYLNLSVGLTIFAIGLFKKAVLADGIAVYATPVFSSADQGLPPDFFSAWGGALAYTFQLYFDFSGYCDMAIGAARMFGIKLPLNFHSPYKATSIIDFWRRWHMTLSRFLKDYVYIPLGGSRKGPNRRHINLMATMLIGGLWHGAGWTFIIWGGLHGTYLAVNHGWRFIRSRLSPFTVGTIGYHLERWAAWSLTFLSVVFAWVFFRAESLDGAMLMIGGMTGQYGATLPLAVALVIGDARQFIESTGVSFVAGGGTVFLLTYSWIAALMCIAVIAPNSQEILARYRPGITGGHDDRQPDQTPIIGGRWFLWRPTLATTIATAVVLVGGILALPQVSEFLYFQF